ncbi:MAG TPA: hypothetical protein VGN72_02625 [Tepidisphaeraceae bacterium]|jgi:hypothetical protein|nr:hypothetical protein [Tepidisphaeraceae bacterium]
MRNAILLITLIVLICTTPSHAQTLFQRFGGVKQWELRYTYTASGPYTWEEGGRTTNRSVYNLESSGKILLEREDGEPAMVFNLHGKGPVNSSISKRTRETAPGNSIATRYDEGSGTSAVGVHVSMNLEDGTYDISIIDTKGVPTQYGGTEKWSTTDRKWGPASYDYGVSVPTPAPAELVLTLPEGGRVISGNWSHAQAMNHAKSQQNFDEEAWLKQHPSAGGVRWTLVPADAVDVELQVEIANYADWLPVASLSEDKPGTTATITAKVVGKDGGKPAQKAVRMTYRLSEVSREKGVCLNWPQKNAGTAPDLRFEPEKNAGDWKVSDEGATLASPDGEYEETNATLSCFDFGAYGTILVTAELMDGRVIVGHLKDDTARGDILLPKRAVDSKIGDKWKKLAKFTGKDTDDQDEQTGNDKKGDGLTAYEEYRGLIVLGKPTRTTGKLDPMRKELAVLNKIGAPAKQGFDLFRSASGIEVVELKEGELPESRHLNLNRGVASGGEQYAILLKEEALPKSAGENRPVAELRKTPRKSEMAVVDVAGARSFYARQAAVAKAGGVKLPYTAEQDIANTIAHEIAHGVGAPHHGKQTEFDDKRVLTPRMVDWHAYGQDGVELLHATSDLKLDGEVGRPGNDASGDATCIMAYTNYYAWAAIGRLGMPLSYYAVPPQPLGHLFCTSPTATGMNLPRKLPNGTEIPGYFGDAVGQGAGAPVGNCRGAMTVRDWE